jgi:hypothetical protein
MMIQVNKWNVGRKNKEENLQQYFPYIPNIVVHCVLGSSGSLCFWIMWSTVLSLDVLYVGIPKLKFKSLDVLESQEKRRGLGHRAGLASQIQAKQNVYELEHTRPPSR